MDDTRILIPGYHLPSATTDAQAELMRAEVNAVEWSRDADGTVILWVER